MSSRPYKLTTDSYFGTVDDTGAFLEKSNYAIVAVVLYKAQPTRTAGVLRLNLTLRVVCS